MEVVGQTRDDAAGEAFDKAAKMLGLTYPGGPLVDKFAAKGDPDKFKWPDTDIPGLDYSFSGIKTAILYFLRDQSENDPDFVKKNLSDLCASIQKKIVDIYQKEGRSGPLIFVVYHISIQDENENVVMEITQSRINR